MKRTFSSAGLYYIDAAQESCCWDVAHCPPKNIAVHGKKADRASAPCNPCFTVSEAEVVCLVPFESCEARLYATNIPDVYFYPGR